MKQRVFALMAVLFLMGMLVAPALADAPVGHVLDEAQLLGEQQEQQLQQQALQYAHQYECGLYIATVNDYRTYGYDVMDAAISLYKQHDMGVGSGKDGALLLLSIEERDYALICYGTKGNQVFDEKTREEIEQSFLPYFRKNDWHGGFQAYLQSSRDALAGNRFKQAAVAFFLVLVCPAAISLVVMMVLKSQMKSVKIGSQATQYVLKGSEKLQVQEDIFTHTTEVRHKIEQPSSSQSGGRSSSSSRGGFSGSSGKF